MGRPFNVPCLATGGMPPYTFSMTGGTLPAGLTFNSSTGTLTGTATTASQTGNVSINVTDSSSPPQQASTGTYYVWVQQPPVETGLVTITATSGSIVNTTTIAVTVSPQ